MLGHEFVGVVEDGRARGRARRARSRRSRAAAARPCLDGDENLCVACRFAGHGSTDGALRQLMPWPERLAPPRSPTRLADAEAALLEPLGVALHALELGRVGPGAGAGVYGCGPLGLLLVQVLRLAGRRRRSSRPTRSPHRAEAARGARRDERAADPAGGHGGPAGPAADGLDVAFEVAGDDDAVATAIDTLRPGGRLVLVGIPDRRPHVVHAPRSRGARD